MVFFEVAYETLPRVASTRGRWIKDQIKLNMFLSLPLPHVYYRGATRATRTSKHKMLGDGLVIIFLSITCNQTSQINFTVSGVLAKLTISTFRLLEITQE